MDQFEKCYRHIKIPYTSRMYNFDYRGISVWTSANRIISLANGKLSESGKDYVLVDSYNDGIIDLRVYEDIITGMLYTFQKFYDGSWGLSYD